MVLNDALALTRARGQPQHQRGQPGCCRRHLLLLRCPDGEGACAAADPSRRRATQDPVVGQEQGAGEQRSGRAAARRICSARRGRGRGNAGSFDMVAANSKNYAISIP